MFPVLSDDQRLALQEHGQPLPIVDEEMRTFSMLLTIHISQNPEGTGFLARIPSIAAYGEGDTKEAASLALSEALRAYQDAFHDA